MINLSFVCAEWACEARKYIHQRDEDGRYFFLDSWLSSRLDNGAGPTVVALLPPALWPAVGPCISNVDASRRCFSKESAAKISKLVPDLEILVASVAFSKSWFKNGYSIHTVFDGSLQFLNVKELTLWVNGPCPFVEVRSQTYPGPESSYELTPEQEVSESETMLRAFPRLTVLSLDNHICPVLEAILSMLENAPPSLESIYLVVRSEWVTKKIVAQYPLLMQPHWIQIPITKILFVVFVGIEYPTFREDVFFFQVLLNHCSLTLEKLEITELTAHMDSPKVTIAFPKMPRLRKIKLVQMPWPPHICYRYFTPQVQDDDPAIQFPSLEELLFDGVQCYQSSEKCYDLDATLFMIEALFPSETKPCESLQMLSIFSGVHDEVWQNDEDIMRLLPPPMGHLEVEKNHLCQALPSTIARFKGKILSRFPNLVTECENYIASI
ncbi:uncharacterized protein LOC118433268 [Folsomia candida]|uniref:uncharacterized protein LOC118433268 n=1 Tax=Folsomia candida TaxID=158441 RepID=UPI001605142A|nr:uncharacterized protein LOC118433268 [Folsomia candida]